MRSNETQVGSDFLRCAIARFEHQKTLADRAVAQVSFEAWRRPLDAHTNSIVVIMKHVAGNLLSRWTDFMTADGEKPERHRDREFLDDFASREELLQNWERGWAQLFKTMRGLTSTDLARTVYIRGHAHTVIEAILRATDHNAYHIGQVVQLARHHAGERWETLSVPRGGSDEYNRAAWGPVGRPPAPSDETTETDV